MTEVLINQLTPNSINLILNRPNKKNALNNALINQLAKKLHKLETDDTIKLVVISGANGTFSAGVDLKEIANQTFNIFSENWHIIMNFKKPILAAVNGYCLGGGLELAMMCDFIIADDTAQFGQPEIKVGLMPGLGGTQRLTKLIGKSLSMDMCLTGKFINAQQALQSGLISRLIAQDKFNEIVHEYAKVISNKPLAALLKVKEAIKFSGNLEHGLALEKDLFSDLLKNEESKELIKQFLL